MSFKLYKTYSFRTKDPVIDLLRTAVKDAGMNYRQISDASGVSTGTLYNWFGGPTRRPQFAATQAVAKALGYELQLVKVAQVRHLKLVKGGRR